MKTFKDTLVNENSMDDVSNKFLNTTSPITPVKLPHNVISILNERIIDEYNAYFLYTNAANWCKDKNFKKAAAFFEKEATGELEHAIGLQNYLTQWNIIPTIRPVDTQITFVSLIDIINKAYTIEFELLTKYSSDLIGMLSVHPATFNFLQKYVDIQNAEVEEYSDLLNALELINTDNKFEVLYFENTYF